MHSQTDAQLVDRLEYDAEFGVKARAGGVAPVGQAEAAVTLLDAGGGVGGYIGVLKVLFVV